MVSKLKNPKNFNVELIKENKITYMKLTCNSDVFDRGNNVMRHPKVTFAKMNLNSLELIKKDDECFAQFKLSPDKEGKYLININMLDCCDE